MQRPAGLTDLDMPPFVWLWNQYMGFEPTISDPRKYVQFNENGDKALISVHVDDFNYYLGMFIWRDRPQIKL